MVIPRRKSVAVHTSTETAAIGADSGRVVACQKAAIHTGGKLHAHTVEVAIPQVGQDQQIVR